MHRVEQLAEMVEADGGVMIAAHPYRRYMPWYELEDEELQRGLEKAMANPAYKHCVALETLHGRGAPSQNEFSEQLRQMLGMRGSGGSDSHQADHVGRCATRFERRISNLSELIAELKEGRFEPVDRRTEEEAKIRVPRV